jgi:uncharacterized protein (TIGR02453 family)
MNEFNGFPNEGLQFLRELKSNNNREWFQARKSIYTDSILEPAQDFVVALGERLKVLSPGFQFDTRTNGSGSIMRIYRDVRFSKDKTPYKTNIGIVFWEGSRKKMENPGYFLHFDSEGGNVYAGHHQFHKSFLASYRQAVDDLTLGKDLEKAIEEVQMTGQHEVGGEHYKRVPRGYDPDHARADLLRHNGLWAKSPTISAESLGDSGLVDLCFNYCQDMLPLHQWLVTVDQTMDT